MCVTPPDITEDITGIAQALSLWDNRLWRISHLSQGLLLLQCLHEIGIERADRRAKPGRGGPLGNLGAWMMAAIRPTDQIAEKWAEVTPGRAPQYAAGVAAPQRDWARNTAAAKDAYNEGVTSAIARGAFEKGVKRAGTDKWQRGSVEKGVSRFGPGVQLAQSAYAAGFAPFRDAIERVTLPPRFARRDPRNLLRVEAIVNAMKAVKEGQSS